MSFGNDSRSYLYYKNDDDDYTLFYSSPLGRLDRLTLKLLTSDGDSVKTTFGDTDIFTTTTNAGAPIATNEQFFNGSFVKDNILNTNTEQKARVTVANGNELTTSSTIVTAQNELLVNLSNQIEYVFEIKTQEPDPTSQLRPTI